MKIKSIKRIKGTRQKVHNIETINNNNYFANGVLVHNCFAYFFKTNNPACKEYSLKSIDVDKLKDAMIGQGKHQRDKMMYEYFYSKKFLLHWGGLADPFCYFERNNRVGLDLIKHLGDINYPTLFSFKGNTIFDDPYVTTFDKYSKQKNFAFQISMVTFDDQLAKLVEVGVPLPSQRIKAIKMLSSMGYYTILRLRPYIIGVTDPSIDELLVAALEAGIKGISMEFFALDARSNEGMKKRYDWLAKFIGTDNLLKYFSALSPSERGGYMRLNRLVKDSHVKKVYRFCIENNLVFGCSDPDFKELNTSGSCCAMPDDYPENRNLENWSRNQMTYHLKEARKTFHKTGVKIKIHFDDVFPKDVDWINDTELCNDHIGTMDMCNAVRNATTLRLILMRNWNNLRSPANVRNYFHGKLMPIGLDENKNLIFQYEPMEYEERWKQEGLTLTK
jgi:DNA repair photolyase